MALTQPIRDMRKIKSLLTYYTNKNEPRNQVLITLLLHSALRISDALSIKCEDIYNFETGEIRQNIQITERKTKKPKTIGIHHNVIKALKKYRQHLRPGAPLFPNPKTGLSISRNHAYRIVTTATRAVGVSHKAGCHSLRKTFGYLAWKGGASPVIIMEIYNHSSFSITKRYLGVNQDEQNAVYLGLKLVNHGFTNSNTV